MGSLPSCSDGTNSRPPDERGVTNFPLMPRVTSTVGAKAAPAGAAAAADPAGAELGRRLGSSMESRAPMTSRRRLMAAWGGMEVCFTYLSELPCSSTAGRASE